MDGGESRGAASELHSMTGFARVEGHDDGAEWAWEARSVNGRSLDVRCRVPGGLERLEQPARSRVADRVARGNVNIALTINRRQGATSYQINRALLAQIQDLAAEVGETPPPVTALIGVRGLFEATDAPEDPAALAQRDAALLETLDHALSALVAARHDEGRRLATLLAARLDELADLVKKAEADAATQPAAIKARLHKLVGDLMAAEPALPEERLAQEAAVLVGKADVREELDRLAAHLAAARDMVDGGGAVGRRLDFLCQELNREANTVCAKSAGLTLTETGLAMKAAVEQLREQVQNVE